MVGAGCQVSKRRRRPPDWAGGRRVRPTTQAGGGGSDSRRRFAGYFWRTWRKRTRIRIRPFGLGGDAVFFFFFFFFLPVAPGVQGRFFSEHAKRRIRGPGCAVCRRGAKAREGGSDVSLFSKRLCRGRRRRMMEEFGRRKVIRRGISSRIFERGIFLMEMADRLIRPGMRAQDQGRCCRRVSDPELRDYLQKCMNMFGAGTVEIRGPAAAVQLH